MKTKTRKRHGKPDPAILADIVNRIVRAADPEKIILFGSAARGTMGPDSDYDVLVVKGGKYHHDRTLCAIYDHLSGTEAAVDVVLVTPADVERYRHAFCLVICPALEDGKVIYEAKALSARRSARMAKSRAQQSLPRRLLIPTVYLEDLCHDAQQAAEKAIKAVFICRGERFPYIHELDELLRILAKNGLTIPKYVRESRRLSRFAVATRYPDRVGPVSRREYRRAVRIATAVLGWAERHVTRFGP